MLLLQNAASDAGCDWQVQLHRCYSLQSRELLKKQEPGDVRTLSLPAWYPDSGLHFSCVHEPASSLELLPAALALSLPSSPVSSSATQTTSPGNTKLLLTCLSTLQHHS
ncbi:hypothetical protein ILYODFUR_025218, partial [Ilyodon furcidens]